MPRSAVCPVSRAGVDWPRSLQQYRPVLFLDADDSDHIVAVLTPIMAKGAIFCSDVSEAMVVASPQMKVAIFPVIHVIVGVYAYETVPSRTGCVDART